MDRPTLCIVGLGYVGLPLAHAFAKAGYTVHGYDVSELRVSELNAGHDRTNEVSDADLKRFPIPCTTDPSVIGDADIVIMALPTPVDDDNKPDLAILEAASRTVGKHLKRGAIVAYESTVYPGVTEEVCGRILEEESGMRCGEDFTLGYSPERINPGDREHTVDRIVKIVAGQDERTLKILSDLYGSVVTAGIHQAPSIKVAEMAKAIENAQRDLNIAFVNEVALLCHKIGIPTHDVLEAAGTKWNFLRFQPGLVGGHCIGVDPYYLVEKARQLGMETHVITAGRAVNDNMAATVVEEILANLSIPPKSARALVLGLTFKENVPDTRNSQAVRVARLLKKAGIATAAHDPHVSSEDMEKMGFAPAALDQQYDILALLVPHDMYRGLGTDGILKLMKVGGVVYDVKSILERREVEAAGHAYLSL